MSKQERHPEFILMSFFLILFISIMIPLYIEMEKDNTYKEKIDIISLARQGLEMERERLEATQAKGAYLHKRLGICVDLLTHETFQQFLDTPTPKG